MVVRNHISPLSLIQCNLREELWLHENQEEDNDVKA